MRSARSFRLFLSSTFADFEPEREAIRMRVLPALERFCRERGADCELVDLRWGVPPEAMGDETIMQVCLREIERCRAQSPRPNFILLLGNRYGWRPIPAEIPAHELRALTAVPGLLPGDVELIAASYRIDANAVPPIARLRPAPGPPNG